MGDQNSPGNGLGGASGGGFASGAGGGAGGSGAGGSETASAAGHGGLATGGAMMGGAAGVAGGGSNFGGASGGGLGGAVAGAGDGAAGSNDNPYGACVGEDATDNSCPVPGSICHADFGCQPPCPTGTVSCPEPPAGGTASPYCQQRFCRLDCGFGKTCPAGMACNTGSAFCTSNGL
jgi:hypothetical protein